MGGVKAVNSETARICWVGAKSGTAGIPWGETIKVIKNHCAQCNQHEKVYTIFAIQPGRYGVRLHSGRRKGILEEARAAVVAGMVETNDTDGSGGNERDGNDGDEKQGWCRREPQWRWPARAAPNPTFAPRQRARREARPKPMQLDSSS